MSSPLFNPFGLTYFAYYSFVIEKYHPYGVKKRKYKPFGYRYATPTELRENYELLMNKLGCM